MISRFTTRVPLDCKGTSNVLSICSLYERSNDAYTETVDKTHIISNTLIHIYDTTYTDAVTFKAAMSGVYLYYELANPIEVELSPSKTMSYAVQPGGTEQLIPEHLPSTTPSTAEIIMDVTYPLNAVGTIQNLPHNYMNERTLDSLISALNTSVPTHTFAKTTVNGYLQITTTAKPTTE